MMASKSVAHQEGIAHANLTVVRMIWLNIFGFGIVYYWSALTSILLPQKLMEFVPESGKGTALGLLTGVGSLILIFIEPVAGVLSDRSGSRFGKRRPFISAGAIGMSVFLLTMSLAPTYGSMIVAFVFLKIFWGFAEGSYPALLPDVVPESQRGQASGYLGMLQLLGAVAGVFVSAKVLAHAQDWHRSLPVAPLTGAALATITVVLICTLVLCLAVREVPQGLPPRTERNFLAEAFEVRPLLRHRAFLWLTLSRMFWYFGFNTLFAFLLYYVKDVLHRVDYADATGNLVSVVYAMALPTVVLAGIWSDRVGRRKPFIYLSSIVMVVAAVGFILMKSYAEAIGAMALWGLGGGIFTSLSWAMATESFPEAGSNARYLAIWISISQGLPWLIAPPIGGVLLDRYGFASVFVFVIVSFIIGLLIFYFADETGWKANPNRISNPNAA